MAATSTKMERIVALCKRRGFIFQSSEIYGGIAGFWDYGPLGTELKRNIKNCWWHDMVMNPPPGPDGKDIQMVGLDASIIMNPKVWEASGHVGGFSDPMVDCKECKSRFRSDQLSFIVVREFEDDITSHGQMSRLLRQNPPIAKFLVEDLFCDPIDYVAQLKKVLRTRSIDFETREFTTIGGPVTELLARTREGRVYHIRQVPGLTETSDFDKCPKCEGKLTEPREFNLMLESHTGAVRDEAAKVYLRPETAQGIFVNFKNVMDSSRVKVPFGIAQIGKAFRNEINPRNYTFRSREFEQMEIEFFCHENDARKWYECWRDIRLGWYESLGIKSSNLRPREQDEDERAHYSQACIDIEYLFPFSDEPQELEGVAHRGCYDLSAHGKAAKGKETAFAVMDDATKERFVPHVIEPSAGVDRFALATITEAYTVDENRASPEFMKFHPRLAPIKAAVFPLVGKDGMPEIAEPIYREIKKVYPCQYDVKQSIGKRYARMDEAGTPFCFTIDGQTKEDGTLTVRNRDDASQKRINKSQCLAYLRDHLEI